MRETRTVGERLILLRKEMGISQGELAGMLGCSQSYLSRVERGVHVPSIGNVAKMAETLGVSVGGLIGEREVSMGDSTADAISEFVNEASRRQPRIMPLLQRVARGSRLIPEGSWEFGSKSILLTLEMLAAALPEEEGSCEEMADDEGTPEKE